MTSRHGDGTPDSDSRQEHDRAVGGLRYPPRAEPVICADGKQRTLGDQRYLNRLNEYLATTMAASASKDLAKAELALFDAFMRRLNDLASKGVHAEVTPREARQGLVGSYMFLSAITRHAS